MNATLLLSKKATSTIARTVAFFMGFFMLASTTTNAQCNYTLEVSDSWGDGWNGASSLTISANGSPVLTVGDAEFSTGNNASFNFQVNTGADITAAFTGGAGFPDYAEECGYRILDASGLVLVNRNYNATGPPADITTGTITAACPACLVVSNLSSTSISTTTASISWSGGSGTYAYANVLSGDSVSASAIMTTTDTFVNLSGLSAQTSYDFYVASICGSDTSAEVLFSYSTSCNPASLPYSHGFEGGSLDACWAANNLSGSGNWQVATVSGDGFTPNTGSYLAYLLYNGGVKTANLVSAPIDMTSASGAKEISVFLHRHGSSSALNDFYRVYINTIPDTAGGTELLTLFARNDINPTVSANGFYEYTMDVPSSFNNSSQVYVIIHGSASGWDVAVDDLTVREKPYDIALTGFANPTNPVAAGFQNISVNIENNSGVDLNNAQIRWFINGSQQAPANFTFNPAIAPGQSQTITLGGANLTTAPFELSAFILSSNSGTPDVDASNDTIMGSFCGPISGSFTVGGASADFETLADVAEALQCGVDGPTTFNINPGTYQGQLIFTEVFGASATNTITFDGGDADDVLITWGTLQQPTIVMDGADYFTFTNVTIEHSSATGFYAYGVQLTNQADWNTFDNCKFTMPVSTSTNRSHIAAIASTNVTTLSTSTFSATNGNNANNLTVKNCVFDHGYHAVVVRGSDGSNQLQNITIENCEMENYGYSIYAFATDGLVIKNNHIKSTTPSLTTYRAVYNYFGSNYEFRGNEVNSFAYGFENINTNDGLVVNNMISGSGGTSTVARGFQASGSSNITLHHNSIYTSLNTQACYFTTTSGLDIQNNIFAAASNFAFQSFASATFDVLDYNLVYRADGGNEISVSLGTTYTSLADAQADSFVLNSFSGNPLFNSTSDLRSQYGLLQNNSGAALGVAFDIDGNVRSATTPDMGAQEYEPILGDLAVTGIAKLGACFGASDTVVVTIENVSAAPIDFAVNNATITLNMSGAGTFTNSLLLDSDTILGGESAEVMFIGVDVSTQGMYNFEAYSTASFDVISSNDTAFGDLEYPDDLVLSASNTNVTDPTEIVALEANTPYVFSDFRFTEIGQFNGATIGAPVGGRPSWLTGDDYVEISGLPNADISGYSIEKWSSNSIASPNVTHTFPQGTFLSPNGTLVLATFGGTVNVPEEFFYVANSQASYSSTGYSLNVLRNPNGDAVDVVLTSTSSVVNANANVAGMWSGPGANTSNWGGRLVGEDTDDNTNWISSSATFPQDPNTLNGGYNPFLYVFLPEGTAWLNSLGDTVGTTASIEVGPFTASGAYVYTMVLPSSCGLFTDSITINATIIQNDVGVTAIVSPTNDCNKDTLPLVVSICNFGANTVYNVPVTANINGQIVPAGLIDSIPGVTCEDIFLFDIPVPSLPATADITVWTALAGDSDNSNDTTSVMNITVDAPPADPLTTNDTSCTGNGSVTATGNNIFWFNTSGEYIDFGNTYTFDGLTMNDTVLAIDARPTDKVIITEIGQWNGTTPGQPAAGRPSYLNGDDYVEITGPANGDLEGYTFEKWNSTSATTPNVVHTFAPGSFLSPDGTLILETFGGTVDSPSDFLYVANTQSSYFSSGYSANVLRDPDGNIVDAVLFSTNTIFNPNTGVTTEWSGAGTNGGSSWGIRLEGPDTDDNTNWVQATGAVLQDPNVRNNGVVTRIPDLTCASNAIQAVFYYNAISIDSIVVADVSACGGADGAITVFATGNDVLGNGFQYSIDGGQTFQGANTFTNLSASPVGYDIVVTNGICDENGGNVQVGQPDAPPAPIVPMDTAVCSGFFGTYTLNVVPDSGTSVVWYTSPTLTSSVATGNSVTPADNPGVVTYYVVQEYPQPNCVSTASTVTVEVFPIPAAPATIDSVEACFGETVTLSAMGTNILWSESANQMDTLGMGDTPALQVLGFTTYYASQSVNGCRGDVDSTVVNLLNSPLAPVSDGDLLACDGDVITALTVTATEADVRWYSDASLSNEVGVGTSFAPVFNGPGYQEFYVTQTSPIGCQSPATFITATVNVAPQGAALGADLNYCDGDAIALLSGASIPGTTLEWYGDMLLTDTLGSGSIMPANTIGTTTYYAVLNNGNCISPVDMINVTITAAPASPVATADTVEACSGDALPMLSATGTGLVWYTDAALTNQFATGNGVSAANTVGSTTYYVIASDNGCFSADIDSMVATIHPSVTLTAASIDVANCLASDGEVSLTPAGGTAPFSYAINGGTAQNDSTFTGLGIGSYVGSVTDANGCTATASVVSVGAPDQRLALVDATTAALTYCDGDSLGELVFTDPNAVSGTITIYSNASLTSQVGTGANFQIPNTIGTTTYYAVSSAAGCVSPAISKTVTINAIPATPVASNDMSYCFGQTIAPITASGGTGTYSWFVGDMNTSFGSGASRNPTPTPGVRTYYVTQTVNGCVSDADSVTITINALPAIPDAGINVAVCSNVSLTALTATGNGGTYNWYSNSGLTSLAGTGASLTPSNVDGTRTFYLTETDGNGCRSGADAVNYTIHPSPMPMLTNGNVTYCENDTILDVQATSIPATYSWTRNGMNVSSTLSADVPAMAGVYSFVFTAVTNNSCTASDSTVVTVNEIPTTTITADLEICSDETITLESTGGDAYSWNTGFAQASLTVTPTNSNMMASVEVYSVTVSNSFNCSVVDEVEVTVNRNPVISVMADTSNFCQGQSVNVMASGADSYSWSTGDTGATINNIPAATATYVATGSLATGCFSQDSVTVDVYPNPVIGLPTTRSINYGANTVLDADVSDGTAPYNYSWSPMDSLSNVNEDTTILTNVTTVRVINLNVTDDLGCSANSSIVVTPIGGPLTLVLSADDSEICIGDETTLMASASGGDGNYTITWSPSMSLSSANGDTVTANPTNTTTYQVSVFDGFTTVSDSITLTVNPLPTVSVAGNTVICEGESTTLTASGADSYVWFDNSTNASISLDSLPVGLNTFSVVGTTTATGCTFEASGNVFVYALPNVSAGSNAVVCEGEEVTFTATGAGVYDWSNGSDSASIVVPFAFEDSSWTVTGTDVNGCINTADVSLTVNPVPSPFIVSNGTDFCVGDTITLEVIGDSIADVYAWNDGNFTGANRTIIANISRNYAVVAIDLTTGCSASDTISIVVNSNPTVTTSGDYQVFPNVDAQVSAMGAGGMMPYQYSWSPVSAVSFAAASVTTANVSSTSTLTVTVEDANGCQVSADVVATVIPFPIVDIGPNRIDDANGRPAFEGDYFAFEGNVTSSNLGNSSFPQHFIQDATGGINLRGQAVRFPDSLEVGDVVRAYGVMAFFNGLTQLNVDSVVFISSGVAPAAAVTNAPQASNEGSLVQVERVRLLNPTQWPTSPTGSRNVDVHTQAGDTFLIRIVNITELNGTPAPPSAFDVVGLVGQFDNSSPFTDGYQLFPRFIGDISNCTPDSVFESITVCDGATANVNGIDRGAGVYVDTYINTSFCDSVVTTTISEHPNSQVAVSGALTICVGESTTLTGTNSANYVWDGTITADSITVSPTATTSYSVEAVDVNGCFTSASITVVVNALPAVSAGADVAICAGDSTTLTASGADTYVWDGSVAGASQSVNPAVTTTYYVVGTDANGCSNTDSVVVSINALPTVTVSNDITFCQGSSALLTASGGTAYSWSNGDNSSSIQVAPTTTTTYTVTVTDGNNCSETGSVVVTVNPLPTVVAGADTTICEGASITFIAQGAATYQWVNGPSLARYVVSPTSNTTYEVEGVDANGCFNQASVTVTVTPAPVFNFPNLGIVCENSGVVSLAAVTPSGGVFTGPGISGTDFNPAGLSGPININYTVSSAGCDFIANASATVNQAPVVSLSPLADICDGNLPLILSGGAPAGGSYSGNGVTGISFNPASPGVYDITYSVTGTSGSTAGCTGSAVAPIEVLESPVVDLGADIELDDNNPTATLDAGNPGATYAWSAGLGTNQTASVSAAGVYSVTVTASNSCSASDEIRVTSVVGIGFAQGRNIEITYMPNPSNGLVQMEVLNLIGGEQLEVQMMDLTGKVVYTERMLAGPDMMRHQFDFTALPAGIYFMNLKTNDEIHTSRLIIR